MPILNVLKNELHFFWLPNSHAPTKLKKNSKACQKNLKTIRDKNIQFFNTRVKKKISAFRNVFLDLILATNFVFRTEHKRYRFIPKLNLYMSVSKFFRICFVFLIYQEHVSSGGNVNLSCLSCFKENKIESQEEIAATTS